MCDLNLDVLLFPESIGFNVKTGKYDEKAFEKIKEISPKWHEALQGLRRTNTKRDSIQISNEQMISMHNKGCEIIEKNISQFASKKDAVIGIERYLAENVTYDDDVLDSELRMASSNGIATGPVGGGNGAYNAIMFNKSVCEGYSRAMRYLLKLKGINSRQVRCIAGEDTIGMSDNRKEDKYTSFKLPNDGYHSVICIEDEDYLYCDPTWDASRYRAGDKSLPYCLLNKEEISKTHTLEFSERKIANEHSKVSRNEIMQSLKSNDLFKKTRISNVEKAENDIKNEVYKGQVIEKRDEKEL